jgi:hypothetical protein
VRLAKRDPASRPNATKRGPNKIWRLPGKPGGPTKYAAVEFARIARKGPMTPDEAIASRGAAPCRMSPTEELRYDSFS